MLQVQSEWLEGVPLLEVRGRFDGSGAAAFDDGVDALGALPAGPVWLDLAGVDYLSSAGLRSLVRLAKARWTLHARVWLIGLQPVVRQVLDMSGLLQTFELVTSRAEALQRLRESATAQAMPSDVEWNGRRHRLTPLAGGEAALEAWAENASGRLTCLSLEDVGLALGRAGLGNTAAQAAEAIGFFLSTGQVISVRPADPASGLPDFMVSRQPAEVPVYVREAVQLTGKPALFVAADEGASPWSALLESLPVLLQRSGRSAQACGWIVAAMDAADPAGNGWVGVGYRTADGAGHLEALRIRPLALSADPAEPMAYLHAVLREETLVDAGPPAPSSPVGRWIAWLFAAPAVQPARDRRPQVVFEEEADPPEEWAWIARRLYTDASRVTLRRLSGGFSAATFHAESHDREGRRMLPTVLKLSDPAFSAREDRAYDLYVRSYILNNSAVRMGRCARNEWVGFRYNFLGITGRDSRLTWIGDHLVRRPFEQTRPLFQLLFEQILAPWYGQARPGLIAPYREHDPRTLFKGLVAEAQSVLGIDPDQRWIDCPPLARQLPNPYYVLQHVYPARAQATWPGLTSIVHGDLNLNNVLLDEKENLFVIDFSETHVGDLGSDFARIEPLVLLQMTRLDDEADLAALLGYLQAAVRPASLFVPPFAYAGGDPFLATAHPLVRLLRQEVRQLSGGQAHVVCYLLALLRWSMPIVVFRQLPVLKKQLSAYASGVLAEALLEADPEAAACFRAGA